MSSMGVDRWMPSRKMQETLIDNVIIRPKSLSLDLDLSDFMIISDDTPSMAGLFYNPFIQKKRQDLLVIHYSDSDCQMSYYWLIYYTYAVRIMISLFHLFHPPKTSILRIMNVSTTHCRKLPPITCNNEARYSSVQ